MSALNIRGWLANGFIASKTNIAAPSSISPEMFWLKARFLDFSSRKSRVWSGRQIQVTKLCRSGRDLGDINYFLNIYPGVGGGGSTDCCSGVTFVPAERAGQRTHEINFMFRKINISKKKQFYQEIPIENMWYLKEKPREYFSFFILFLPIGSDGCWSSEPELSLQVAGADTEFWSQLVNSFRKVKVWHFLVLSQWIPDAFSGLYLWYLYVPA